MSRRGSVGDSMELFIDEVDKAFAIVESQNGHS